MFLAFDVKACSENLVKYGVRCAGAVAGLTFACFFTVFAALYVDACSESHVKYGVRCAGAVAAGLQGSRLHCFLRCLRHFMLRHVQKTV